jgi:hypothetical protein
MEKQFTSACLILKKKYTLENTMECVLAAIHHVKSYWDKIILTQVRTCNEISETCNKKGKQIMDSKVQTNKNIPNYMPVIIIRGKVKNIFVKEVAMLREAVIFTFTHKRIISHSRNRCVYVIEQLKMYCVLCRMKNLKLSCW